MTNLQGRWALVTGAGRGIGRQISLGLAGQGCNVLAHSRTTGATAGLLAELRAMGVQAMSLGAELSEPEEVERLIGEVRALAAIDVLVNNAALGGRSMPPYEVTGEEYRRLFEVNCVALFRLCYAFLPPMIERGFGRVVNVTSGIANQPGLMGYAVSKAGVDKFTRDFAPTLEGTGVTMTAVDPGWLKTDLGGPDAPGEVESVLPGALVPILLDGPVPGAWLAAQAFAGQSIAEALAKA